MDSSQQQRIKWIDILRGLAIVAVVMGHLKYSPGNYALKDAIYSFHMGMFFVLAGCTSHLSLKNDSMWFFIKKKSVALLLPYTIWNFLVLPYPSTDVLIDYNFTERFVIFISGRCNNGGAFWFLLTLFVFQVIFAFYVRVIEARISSIWMKGVVLLLMYIPIIALNRLFGGNGNSFGLATQVYLFYIPFMTGACMLRYREVWNILFSRIALFVFVVLALYIPSLYGDFNSLGMLSRVTGIGITCLLINMISSGHFLTKKVNEGLSLIGKYSLGIYIFHYTFVSLFSENVQSWIESLDSLVTFCFYFPVSFVIALLCIGIVKLIEQSPAAAFVMLGKVKR